MLGIFNNLIFPKNYYIVRYWGDKMIILENERNELFQWDNENKMPLSVRVVPLLWMER